MNRENNSLKPILVVVAILIAVSAVYGLFSVYGGAPQIEITPSNMDLGDVTKDGFNYMFTVRNTGKKTLEIGKVSTSCGCTLANIDSDKISPGESTGLHVTFNPKLMEEEVKGKISRIIFIKSNDPENPEVEIKITANVVS
jgi:hypothetical protein